MEGERGQKEGRSLLKDTSGQDKRSGLDPVA